MTTWKRFRFTRLTRPYRGVRYQGVGKVDTYQGQCYRKTRIWFPVSEMESLLRRYGRAAVLEAIDIVADINRLIGSVDH